MLGGEPLSWTHGYLKKKDYNDHDDVMVTVVQVVMMMIVMAQR